MTRQIDNTGTAPAPKAWEAVRTVASVVIAVSLLMIAAGTTVFDGVHAPNHVVHRVSVPDRAPGPGPAASRPPVTAVFYLVRTPEQAYLADIGESDRISEAGLRQHEILYARNDEELRRTSDSILDHILAYDVTPSVQVIDLREINTTPGSGVSDLISSDIH